MNLTIRTVTKAEYDIAAKAVWDACFPHDGTAFIDYYFEKRSCPENVLAAFYGERMVADLHIIPKTAKFFGVEKKIAFIAGVGTHPEFRMQGIAAKLLQAAEPLMLQAGYLAAMLHPFLFAFYEKFGYEVFASCRVCKRFLGETASVAELCDPTPEYMLSAYRIYMDKYAGLFERTERDFNLLIEEANLSGDLLVAGAGSYAWGRVDDGGIELYELAGERPLILVDTILRKYEKPITFRLPADHPEGMMEPFNMVRILDDTAFMKDIPIKKNFWQLPEYAPLCFGLERY